MKLNYFAAAVSAIIVGTGQIMKGESQKGVLFLLGFYFVLPAVVYLSLLLNAYLFIYALGCAIVSGIIIWAYGVGDALIK
jgi:hypothetical protein